MVGKLSLVVAAAIFLCIVYAQSSPSAPFVQPSAEPYPTTSPTPTPSPAACLHKQKPELADLGGEWYDFRQNQFVCVVAYYVCGKTYTRKSPPALNKAGVCDSFYSSTIAELKQEEICCDCIGKGPEGRVKGCKDLDDASAQLSKLFDGHYSRDEVVEASNLIDKAFVDFIECNNPSAFESLSKLSQDLRRLQSPQDEAARRRLLRSIEERYDLLKVDVCSAPDESRGSTIER